MISLVFRDKSVSDQVADTSRLTISTELEARLLINTLQTDQVEQNISGPCNVDDDSEETAGKNVRGWSPLACVMLPESNNDQLTVSQGGVVTCRPEGYRLPSVSRWPR